MTSRVRHRRARARALLACAVALVVATPALADFREDYADGLKAAGDGKWAEVEAKMRAAAAESATPQVQTRLYGQRFEPYVPLFFMGIAAARRGDCANAVQYLTHGPTQAVLRDARAKRRLDDFIPLATKGLADCEARLAGGSTTAPSTTTPSTTPPSSPTPPSSTASTTSPSTTSPSTTAPTVASNTPPSTTRPSAPATPTTTRPTPPATAPTTASTTRPPSPTSAPVPPAATASTAPAELTAAIDDYLRGRYQQLAARDPSRIADRRARWHALLLRAAARHTLALMQGGDRNLLGQAEADVRAAKALDPAAPDAQLYSPRFRTFYSQTR